MTPKKILKQVRSNWLLGLIISGAIVLITIASVYYITFPYIFEVEDEQLEATIVGILVAVFVLFFGFTPILYSISTIPTKLLIKYCLLAKESIAVIIYFFIAILFSGFTALHSPIVYGQYLLFFTLFLSLVLITAYFFWFIKRVTAERIIEQITSATDRTLEKINEYEKDRDKDYVTFHEFIRNSRGKYLYDPTYALRESLFPGKYPCFTIEAKEKSGAIISEIKINEIRQKLEKISTDPHIKVIFEVEPTLIIPNKYPYERMLDSYRLLSIVYEHNEGANEDDYENAQLDFVKGVKGNDFEIPPDVADKSKYVAEEVSKILSTFAQSVQGCFKLHEHKRWTNKANKALSDLASMSEYSLRKEQAIDPLCSALDKIIYDQFFALRPDIYLHLRSYLFGRILEIIDQVNAQSLKRDDTLFFDRMLALFYRLIYTEVAKAKNPLIYDDIISGIRRFHLRFIMTESHSYNPGVAVLVLNISELAISSLKHNFQAEEEFDSLDKFYKHTFDSGVETAFQIVKDYVDWFRKSRLYNEMYLKDQMQHLINFIPFYKDRPADYFSDQYEYYKIRRQLKQTEDVVQDKKLAVELAEKKAAIVNELKDRLQIKIMQLSISMLKRYTDKELDPEIIWKIALPAVKNSCYQHGLKSFFTRRFKDVKWQHETQELFQWQEMHPAGPHELYSFDLDIFWVILNLFFHSDEHFFPNEFDPSQLAHERKETLLQTIDNIEAHLWAPALNITAAQFENRRSVYKNFVEKIRVTNR